MGLISVQFSSVAQSCPTLCDPMSCSTPGLPVHYQLPEPTQTHVHRVGDAIQPSHPLSSPSPPALSLSQHQGLFKWVSSLHQVAKVLEFQLQHLAGLKSGVSRAAFLLQILGEDPSPCLFQLLDATHIPWLVAPSSFFRTSKSFSDSMSLVLPLRPPSSTFKDAYD